ncbi:hypothetical protein Tco_0103320 [Tanacetum coccineum]
MTLAELKSAKPTTAASTRTRAKGLVIHEQEQVPTPTVSSQQPSQEKILNKGKAKMIEPEPMKKLSKKDQLKLDEEVAQRLQVEFYEQERIEREKAEAKIALKETWDDIQAKIEADCLLDERLQTKEQEELTIKERAKFFQQLLEKRRKHFAAKKGRRKEEHTTNKSSTKEYHVYLSEKHRRMEAQRFEEQVFYSTREQFKRAGDELEQESIKSLMEVILDEEEVAVDAIPLATKPPSIIDWKIHKEGKKSYYQIIRADGSSKMYLMFSHMLKSFDREDLETLYKLGRIIEIKRLHDDLEVTTAKAKIEADCLLAERLQIREQEELTIEERAKLFQQLLEKRRKHFAAKKGRRKEEQTTNKSSTNRSRIIYEDIIVVKESSKKAEVRLVREKDEANVALIEEWNDIQAKIETYYELAQRLQAEEQEELTIEEKSKLFVQLLEARKKHFAAKKVEEKRNIPLKKPQQRSIMCTYLKNMAGWKPNDLNNKSFANIQELFNKAMKRVNIFVDMDTELVEGSKVRAEGSVTREESSSKRAGGELKQEKAKKQKVNEDKETAELQSLMEVIPDEEEVVVDAIPLATKPPSIVDYKIIKEGKISYYQIIRADGSSKRYSAFIQMLRNFDREDLETLWKLVKAKHGYTRPEEGYERVLWGDLKTMFEHHVEDLVWRNLQGNKVLV